MVEPYLASGNQGFSDPPPPCILLVGFVTLFAFGPMGKVIGDGLAAGYEWVYALSPIIAGLLLGASVQPMVIFGFHWSLILIAMNNLAVSGHDTVLAMMGPPVFAQAGAALAVMIKSHSPAFKSTCVSAAVSAMFGITEPAMFGVNLPRKKPLIAVCVGGSIGGVIAGISGVQTSAFAFPSLVALPIFFGKGFLLYLIAYLTGLLVAFIATLIFKFDVDGEMVEDGPVENTIEKSLSVEDVDLVGAGSQ